MSIATPVSRSCGPPRGYLALAVLLAICAVLTAVPGRPFAAETRIVATRIEVHQELLRLSAVHHFSISGLEATRGVVAEGGVGDLASRLANLLAGFNHAAVFAPSGRLEHVTIVNAKQRSAKTDRASATLVVARDPVDAAATAVRDEVDDIMRRLLGSEASNAVVSSYFGRRRHPLNRQPHMHQGIDIAVAAKTPVHAVADGTVVAFGVGRDFGRFVRLRHDGGIETIYAHLGGFVRGMRTGRTVRQGDIIGEVGSTGLSTGPHLHYEVLVRSRNIDPLLPATVAVTRVSASKGAARP